MKKTPTRKSIPRGRREKSSITGLSVLLILSVLVIVLLKPQLTEFGGFFRKKVQQLENDSRPDIQENHERGNIYDRNFTLLAGSYPANGVYARPLELRDPEETADRLATILELDRNELLATLKSERGFIWLGRKLSADKTADIEELDLEGIYIIREMNRSYPHRQAAAHVIGFVQDGRGLDGLEFQYDAILQGEHLNKAGLSLEHDPPASGAKASHTHLVLTLDLQIQSLFEQHLAKLLKDTGAVSAMAAAISKSNGNLLALVNLPSYNPNRFWEYSEHDRNNRLVTESLIGSTSPLQAKSAGNGEAAGGGLYGFNQRTLNLSANVPTPDILPAKTKRRVDRWSRQADTDVLTVIRQLINDTTPTVIDLPGAGGRRRETASGLQLLASFSGLFNNGDETSISVLAAVADQASKSFIKLKRPESGRYFMDEATRAKTLKLLDQAGTEGPKGSLLFETCLAPDYLIRSQSDDSRSAIEEIIEANQKGGGSRSVLLAMVPSEDEDIVYIVVLDRAEDWEPTERSSGQRGLRTSPLITMSHRIIPDILLYAQRRTSAIPEEIWQETPVYKPAGQKENSTPANMADSLDRQEAARMPDLTGRSLRSALQVVQQYGLQVKITGSGQIVKQYPVPGKPVKEGDLCVLELRMDN